MIIVQLVTHRQARGAEIATALLSEGLEKAGHVVFFISLYCTDTENKLEVNCKDIIDLNGNKNAFIDFGLLYRLKKLIKKINPDVVQANGSDTFKYASFALYLKPSIPLIYRNISIMSHWVGNRKHVKLFYRFLAHRLDFITSVGEEASADIVNLLNFPSHKTNTIKRGIIIDPKEKVKARDYLNKTYGFKPVDKIIIQVGSLSSEKNHEMIIRVVAQLKKDISNIKLLIVGDGKDKSLLQEIVIDLNLHEQVILTGYKSNVNFYLAGADVVTLTSLVEGVPGVILEAAVQYTPVIAVNVGGVKEVLDDGITGYLLPLHDDTLFAEKVKELLADKAKIKILGSSAYQKVNESHQSEVYINKFEMLYYSIIKSQSRSF